MLLMIASVCTKHAKVLGIIAVFAEVVRRGIIIMRNIEGGWGNNISTYVWTILLVAGTLFIGLAYDDIAKKKSIYKNTNTIQSLNLPIKEDSEKNSVDKLIRLKALLDQEVITQEEFDEKKKQLLNL